MRYRVYLEARIGSVVVVDAADQIEAQENAMDLLQQQMEIHSMSVDRNHIQVTSTEANVIDDLGIRKNSL